MRLVSCFLLMSLALPVFAAPPGEHAGTDDQNGACPEGLPLWKDLLEGLKKSRSMFGTLPVITPALRALSGMGAPAGLAEEMSLISAEAWKKALEPKPAGEMLLPATFGLPFDTSILRKVLGENGMKDLDPQGAYLLKTKSTLTHAEIKKILEDIKLRNNAMFESAETIHFPHKANFNTFRRMNLRSHYLDQLFNHSVLDGVVTQEIRKILESVGLGGTKDKKRTPEDIKALKEAIRQKAGRTKSKALIEKYLAEKKNLLPGPCVQGEYAEIHPLFRKKYAAKAVLDSLLRQATNQIDAMLEPELQDDLIQRLQELFRQDR